MGRWPLEPESLSHVSYAVRLAQELVQDNITIRDELLLPSPGHILTA